VFENRGPEIGVTLHHPHGQVYAYPYVTPRTKSLLDSIASYGPHLMGDILAYEAKSERVLIAGEHCTAFVPFAARWPVEIHLLPHRHVPDLAATDKIRLMLQVTSPGRGADKLKFRAGSETGMGAFIGDIKLETAVARLRDALDRADREEQA
jgi:UDPglucose--hexose-1-phosphate uridylyltransferase